MSEIYITTEGKKVPLKQALEIMTDEFIDAGNWCDQTGSDLRDVCLELKAENERLRAENASHLAAIRNCVNDESEAGQ